MISVVIRTIGRDTLNNAFNSALAEFDNVIVVADAVDIKNKVQDPRVSYLKTGQRFDKYGSAALNMGACAVTTEYFCLLDDDDEFVEGAGDFMRDFLFRNPQSDIVIPGLQFNQGLVLCEKPDLKYGNVAVPTFRTGWALKVPITPLYCRLGETSARTSIPPDAIDFAHVVKCVELGAKVSWYGKILYLVRPKLQGTNGRGK